MNRTVKALAAALMALGLAVVGLPIGGDGGAVPMGPSGCCRQ